MVLFLSCLSGSDAGHRREVDAVRFLSCLSGSDDRGTTQLIVSDFSELPVRQ